MRLNDEVLRAAKRYAAETGRSLTALIEDSLRATMGARQGPRVERRISLTTCAGAPRPGIDLDNSAELIEVMEGRGP